MIDTIFYFVDSLNFDEYQSRLSSGDIADRTIVFAEAQKAIYKDGVNYGNLTKDEMISIVKTIIHENPSYILPIATAVQLGGIMVGATLTIDENGTLNVNPDALPQGPIGPKGDTGETGAAGKDGKDGSQGVAGNFKSTVFKRSTTRPGRPSGGSYDNPVPEGWSDGIPEGTGAIWASSCTFFGTGGSTGWTIPQLQADSSTLDIEFSPSVTQPNAPTGNMPFANHEGEGWYSPESANFSSAGTMIWRAERKVSNGEYSGAWVITRIYGEKGEKGDPGDSVVGNGYTKEEIDNLIEGINANIDEVSSDLDNILLRESGEIEQMINNILDGKNFVKGWQAGWNDEINAYLIQIGVINSDGSKGWSYLETKYNEIKGEVDLLKASSGEGGSIDYEMLSSLIDARIENNASIIELKTRYALTDQDKTVLKWLSSGFYSEASANKAVAEVFASAQDVKNNTSAISALRTVVDGIDGNYVAKTELASEVNNSISGIFTENSSNSAVANLFSRLSNVETTSGDNYNAISGLQTRVQTIEENGAPAASSSVISAIELNKNEVKEILSSAGLINTATLDSAKTALQANIDNAASEIVAAVTNDSSDASIGTKLANYLSGLVTRSSIDKTVSALIAKATGVPVQINKDGFILDRIGANTSGGTRIYITIDPEIEFDTVYDSAQIATIINNCQPTMDAYSNVTAEQVKDYSLPILLQNNNNGGKTWNIIATGVQTVVKDLEASITAGIKDDESFIDAVADEVNVRTKEFNVYNGEYRTSINSEGLSTSTYGARDYETTNIIRYDGSGNLASGSITWDSDGKLSIDARNYGSSHTNAWDYDGLHITPESNSGYSIAVGNRDQEGSYDNTEITPTYIEVFRYDDHDGNLSAKMTHNGFQVEEDDLDFVSSLTPSGVSLSNKNTDEIMTYNREGITKSYDGVTASILLDRSSNISFNATNSITASIAITTTSDERLKTIVDTPEASIENIANARVVDYYMNNNEDKNVELGSIAQDWQAIYPNAVKEDEDGYLSLNYSGVALASAVEAAKEIVKLKAENAELKERLATIEAKLGI